MLARALLALVVTAAVAMGAGAASPPALEAEGIQVVSQTAQSRFPGGVAFTIFLSSSAEINSVRLNYRILPDGAIVAGRPQCTTGTSINCSLTVGNSAQAFLVPGVDILYSWDIADAAGARLETPQARVTYQDDRFRWESMSSGVVTAYYYSGSDDANRSILNAAATTLERMSTLVGTRIDFPVKMWIYATARDMQPAILSQRGIRPNTSNPTTLGEVVFSDTALVSRDTLPLDIARHEITHVVMRQAMKGSLTDAPAWLDEGLAVYAQNQLLPDEISALELALRRNRPLSIFSLTSSTLTQTETSLFYAQAWSTVKFLIETYSPAKFTEFIAALRTDTTSNALMKVYGFNAEGLEDRWRQSVGLPPLGSGSAGQQQGSQGGAIPTIVPFGAQGSGQAAAATPRPGTGQPQGTVAQPEEEGGGSSLVVPVAAGAVVLLLLAGGGYYFLGMRRKPA